MYFKAQYLKKSSTMLLNMPFIYKTKNKKNSKHNKSA